MNKIEKTIWDRSIKIIQRRSMNSYILNNKLKKEFSENYNEIENTIDEIKRVGLVNDNLYNESVINYLSNKNIGIFKLKMEAKKYGIFDEEFIELLKNSNYNEYKACELAISKKKLSLKGLDKQKDKFKLMNFLKSRGFSANIIFKLIK